MDKRRTKAYGFTRGRYEKEKRVGLFQNDRKSEGNTNLNEGRPIEEGNTNLTSSPLPSPLPFQKRTRLSHPSLSTFIHSPLQPNPSPHTQPLKQQQRVRVSQDKLGSRKRCEKLAMDSLRHGRDIVIDRCNFDVGQRRTWIRKIPIPPPFPPNPPPPKKNPKSIPPTPRSVLFLPLKYPSNGRFYF